ncbi:MAG: hypothetical protein P4L69_15790 [Desulfosporosinus sp.]|nr:hypothetical protein [Desulfosporosinus sp.]
MSKYMTCSNRRIEASQQHVVDDYDTEVALVPEVLTADMLTAVTAGPVAPVAPVDNKSLDSYP